MANLDFFVPTGGAGPEDNPDKVKAAIMEGFLQTDKHLHSVARREGWERGGTTVVATLLSPYYIYFANCGDSRAVLCRSGQVCFSTEDHKPYSPLEKERIESAGGSVSFQRINGSLAVSRALGDFGYKGAENRTPVQQMVSPEPEVCAVERSPLDEFLVLACDGVWDTVSNEDLCAFVHNRLQVCTDLRDVCAQVIDLCLYKVRARQDAGVELEPERQHQTVQAHRATSHHCSCVCCQNISCTHENETDIYPTCS